MSYQLHTDGSCLGNPGPGGYACIVIDPDGNQTVLRGNSRGETVTNNQMELKAVLKGLLFLPPPSEVEVFSDSKYVVDTFLKSWYVKWRLEDWTRKDGRKRVAIPNTDLWKSLLTVVERHATVSWSWVRGHSGNPLNEAADRIACLEANRSKEGI